MSGVAPANFGDACGRPLDANLLKFGMFESLEFLFGDLWDLDDFLFSFSILCKVLIANILKALKGTSLIFAHLFLINVNCLC